MTDQKFEKLMETLNALDNKMDSIISKMEKSLVDQYCLEGKLEWLDCFEIESDYQAYWLYYNPDGNDGNGQIVEISIHPDNVPIDETNEDHFWGYLSSVCKTWLHDREDEDFNEYALDMMNWPSDSDTHRNSVVESTMQWLIEWAKENR